MSKVLTPHDAKPRAPRSLRDAISRSERVADLLVQRSMVAFAALILLLVVGLVVTLLIDSAPAFKEHQLSLLFEREWNPNAERYGLLPAIVGTMVSSLLALIIGGLLGVAIAIFLTQDFLPERLNLFLKNLVDLLAAIPSVVYGLWGLAVIAPLLRPLSIWTSEHLGWFAPFERPLGVGGMAPAAIVLGIMILPTIAAISRDSLAAVHPRVKEAAYGLGANRWEVIFGVMLPTASEGIFGGMILGLGRALGETMALAMLLGNRNELSWSIFAPGNTLAALIANSYKEATKELIPRLIYAALILLLITLLVNVIGSLVLQHASKRFQGARS